MSSEILNKILEYKRSVIASKTYIYAALKDQAENSTLPNRFKNAISKPDQIHLIAEIKKASPSKGLIRGDFDPVQIARIYKDHHASAISVLTEDKYFHGMPEFVKQVTETVDLPVLTKDFILNEGQIYEALDNGAAAVLLIVAILDDSALSGFINIATTMGMDCLVEVHTEEELNRAVDAGAEIIGINNRDLSTFEVDINTSVNLIPKVPEGKIIVAESGLSKNSEITQLKDLGANAVLIGETFMKEDNIGDKIREVMDG